MLKLPGRQIVLRDWTEDDFDRWARWMQPEHHWQRLDGPYYPPMDDDEVGEFIARKRCQLAADDFPLPRSDLVVALAGSGELIGRVSWYWQSEETHWLSLGISIYDPAYWGRGIGYEALGLWGECIWAAFPQIVRLDLRTWSGNHGMMRLARKLGFIEEARFRQARIVAGRHYDGLGYGILRDEWAARYPRGFVAHLA